MKKMNLRPSELIESRILLIRGQRVMIDHDLAKLYGVSTKRLNEQVKRNMERFPNDFMFQLSLEEKIELVANCDHLEKLKYSSRLPNAFTEHGAIMLASVLNSSIAVDASIHVVRAFVRLRELLVSHKKIAQKLKDLEMRIDVHDENIKEIIQVIHQLITPPEKPKRQIGFQIKETVTKYSGSRKSAKTFKDESHPPINFK